MTLTRSPTELRPHGLVRREALFGRLSSARAGHVALICAPAGSGKSVLLRSWIDAEGLAACAAWVPVERGERDAQRFWLSVIDALARVTHAVQCVDPAPTFRGEAAVGQLLRDLETLEQPALLVIDDLHELHSPDALTWLELFLARVPAQLRVVLATRSDPRLGLHRLRLSGELTELRASDLRFSLDEAQQLLRDAGIRLSDFGMAQLYERTEGWAAGLRLAAISLAHRPDPERFVTEFSGSERTVAGYLLAEVLDNRPAEVRDLLLRTSLLDRVSGPLADFLTGGTGSERILQELEDANAFVISLDAGRSWFRYHHLFADLLQLELRRTSPASVGPLHREAAQWLEQEGFFLEAIRHAEVSRDWVVAGRLLADHHLDLTLDGRSGAVRELLDAFPHDVADADPEIALAFAIAHLLDGELEESAEYLDLAQQLVDTASAERRPQVEGVLAVIKLVLARWRGDVETVLGTMPRVEAALAARPAGERALSDALGSAAFQNLGVAELWSARIADARRHLEHALALARRAGRPWLEIPPLGHLGIGGPSTGLSLSSGLKFCDEALRIAETRGWRDDPAVVTPLATGALILLWLGRFDETDRWLERAERTLHPDGEPGTELIVHHARGLRCLAEGRLESALTAFGAAERMQALLVSEHAFTTPGRARVLQVQARMGELAAARAAFSELGDEERATCEMRVAGAVIDLAGHEPERAIEVLGPAIEGTAPTMHLPIATTEAQVVEALARERLGERRAAEASLERALELAEPEGIVLPFVLAPVHDILERLPRHRTAHATLRRAILDLLAGSAPRPGGEPAEELSDAELRVVRYLPSNLRAPEIAGELFVSTNTVRTHLRHIYAKLGVHGRAEAVARARQLGLLAPSRRARP